MELVNLAPPSEGLKVILPNGVFRNMFATAEDSVLSVIVSEAGDKKTETVVSHGVIEKAGNLDLSVTINASGELQEGSNFPKESNGSTIYKEEEDKGADDSKRFKPQEGQRNSKKENPSLTKNVTSTSGNKGKDETGAVPSGTSHDSKSNPHEGQGNSKNEKPSLTRNVSSTSLKKGKDETDAAPASAFTNGSGTLHDSKQSNPQGGQGKSKNENPSLTTKNVSSSSVKKGEDVTDAAPASASSTGSGTLHDSKQSKPEGGQEKSKNENPSLIRNVSSTSVKKGKDETDAVPASAFSNGSGTSHDSKQSNTREGQVNSKNENPSVTKNVSLTSRMKGKDGIDTVPASAFSNSSGTSHDLNQSNPQEGQGKSRNENPSLTTNVSSTSVKKYRDETDSASASTFSNGSGTSNPNPEQPTKSMSLSDRQAQLSKLSGKSDREVVMEKTDMKPLKKGTANEYEGDSQSSLCNERAEKRREFYSKLEEKIHAKGVEQSNLQAKSKVVLYIFYFGSNSSKQVGHMLVTVQSLTEAQEAEIKMLRKSLNFKATPLPSFYQEPSPPKPELKMIPLTRPKSPKLGRKKCATPADSDNNGRSVSPARLSLDQRLFQNKTVKRLSLAPPVKRQRRSLTGLPSEKSTSPAATNTRKSSSFEIRSAEKTTSLNGTNEEKAAPSNANNEKTVLPGETVVGQKSTLSNTINEARFFNQEEEQFHLAELNSDPSG